MARCEGCFNFTIVYGCTPGRTANNDRNADQNSEENIMKKADKNDEIPF